MKDINKPGYVYKVILDTPEPHVVYVGSTTQTPGERLGHHATIQQRPTRLNKLIRATGREHFSIEIIEWVADRKERFNREQYWTQQLGAEPDNCNECIGTRHSAEMCERDSINSYRNRAVICENDGKVYRSSIEAAPHYGLCDSDIRECCAKHIKQSKGYYFRYADEDPQSYIDYWESESKLRNLPVRCVETGVIYKNVTTAAQVYKVRRDVITASCRKGSILRRYKVHFEYVKPYAHLLNPASTDSASR